MPGRLPLLAFVSLKLLLLARPPPLPTDDKSLKLEFLDLLTPPPPPPAPAPVLLLRCLLSEGKMGSDEAEARTLGEAERYIPADGVVARPGVLLQITQAIHMIINNERQVHGY